MKKIFLYLLLSSPLAVAGTEYHFLQTVKPLIGQIQESDKVSKLFCEGETTDPIKDKRKERARITIVQYDSKPKTILQSDYFTGVAGFRDGLILSDSSLVKVTDRSSKNKLDITNEINQKEIYNECNDQIHIRHIDIDRNTGEIYMEDITKSKKCKFNSVDSFKGICRNFNDADVTDLKLTNFLFNQ